MTRLTQLPCEAVSWFSLLLICATVLLQARGEILDCEPAAPTAAMAATSEAHTGLADFSDVPASGFTRRMHCAWQLEVVKARMGTSACNPTRRRRRISIMSCALGHGKSFDNSAFLHVCPGSMP